MSWSEYIRAATSEDLLVIEKFFSQPGLSHLFPGLLADVRDALASRGVERVYLRPVCSKCAGPLPTPTMLQAAERREPPLCDACFFEGGEACH